MINNNNNDNEQIINDHKQMLISDVAVPVPCGLCPAWRSHLRAGGLKSIYSLSGTSQLKISAQDFCPSPCVNVMDLVSWISPQVFELAQKFTPQIHPGTIQLDLLLVLHWSCVPGAPVCVLVLTAPMAALSPCSRLAERAQLLLARFPAVQSPVDHSHLEQCGAQIPAWDQF